jgi:hypothetical protein
MLGESVSPPILFAQRFRETEAEHQRARLVKIFSMLKLSRYAGCNRLE